MEITLRRTEEEKVIRFFLLYFLSTKWTNKRRMKLNLKDILSAYIHLHQRESKARSFDK